MPRRSQADLQPENPAVNLEAIARQLGVAVSTVSRALRNSPGIHPSTRLRIQTEAARLGYAVKRRADDRVGSSADTSVRHLLTLAQAINSFSQQGYLSGISRAAQAHHIGVFSHHCSAEDAALMTDPARQPAALRMPDLAGLIFIHRWPEAVVAQLVKNHPAISLIHRYPGLPVDTVGLDDEANLRLLVAHLKERGHTKIGFFGYDRGYSWARARFAAYIGALAEADLPYVPENTVAVSPEAAQAFQPSELPQYTPALRARIQAGVTAWIGSSYVLAQSLCLTLRAAGYKIPGDVEITGYHGGARHTAPSLPRPTSIEIDDDAIGSAAVHLLSQRAQRAVPAPASLLLPGRLIQGDTTSAPRK
jgi:DNA-binding LacI/PurR family transcriptional regulator